jgi:hypothetical protein
MFYNEQTHEVGDLDEKKKNASTQKRVKRAFQG